MAGKRKADYVVVKPIVLHCRQRRPGFTFTACADGVHVTRWLQQGKIKRRDAR